MQDIKIVSRWDSEKVLLCGKYESIKDCLEKNGGADLRCADLGDADLGGADLRGAYLGSADLEGANLESADLRGAYLRCANLGSANLESADLGGADLRGAYLGDADLEGADLGSANLGSADLGSTYLWCANLRGAKNYYNSRDFIQELIRRHKDFTQKEWCAIGQIFTYKLCWESILNRFKREAISISKKLAKDGFDEPLKKIKGEI